MPFLPYSGNAQKYPGLTVPKKNKLIVAQLVTILVDGEEIGFVTDISFDETSRAERIRHLNFADGGRTVEQVPSASDMTLTLSGFSLYRSTLLARIAGEATGAESQGTLPSVSGGSLIFTIHWLRQKRFDIMEEIVHPANPDDAFYITYGDNVITSYSHPVAKGSLYITERVTVQPTWINADKGTISNSTIEPAPIQAE